MYDNFASKCICGNNPTVEKVGPLYDYSYQVVCKHCGIRCPSHGRDEKDAIESWNNFIKRIYSN